MFTNSAQRYNSHINEAKGIRSSIVIYKRWIAGRAANDVSIDGLRRIVEIKINAHRSALTAAKIERETTHYKSI